MDKVTKDKLIAKRNAKIVKDWEKELKKAKPMTKAKFAAKHEISVRTLGRVLASKGLDKAKPTTAKKSTPKKEVKQEKPTASASESKKEETQQEPVADATNEPVDSEAQEKILENIEEEEKEAEQEESLEEPKEKDYTQCSILSWTVGSDKFITMLLDDGDSLVVEASNKKYQDVLSALIAGEYDIAIKTASIKHVLASLTVGSFEINEKGMYQNGTKVNISIADEIVSLFKRNEPVKHLIKFYENLLVSASNHIYENLFKLIKNSGITITEEGYVECFKRVTVDFKDPYTRKIDNSVGSYVVMRRTNVDSDHSRTCSAGLHVCAFKYLTSSGYGGAHGAKVVKCIVRPQDFVAIPNDYNFTKARTCAYYVSADVTTEANRGDFEKATEK